MTFVETELFSKQLSQIGVSDELYRRFQKELLQNPLRGDLIQHSGGIRKARMRLSGQGKSGSARVWYLWLDQTQTLILITAYTKAKTENLSAEQTRQFRTLAQNLKIRYGR